MLDPDDQRLTTERLTHANLQALSYYMLQKADAVITSLSSPIGSVTDKSTNMKMNVHI